MTKNVIYNITYHSILTIQQQWWQNLVLTGVEKIQDFGMGGVLMFASGKNFLHGPIYFFLQGYYEHSCSLRIGSSSTGTTCQ